MRARPRPGWLPEDDVPVRTRLFAHARPAHVRRSAAWSTGGRRGWRRQLVAGVVLVTLAVAMFLLASRPSEPGLTDPKAILDAAMARLAAARSVHVDLDLDGTVSLARFTGAAGPAAPLALTGTHADGDIDLAGRQASLAFEVPALLGLTGRLVEAQDGLYLTSSLTGDGWIALGDGTAFALPARAPLAQLDALQALLTTLAGAATKLDDAACSAGSCYQVRVWLTSEQVQGLISPPSRTPGSGQPGAPPSHTLVSDSAMATIDVRVDRQSLRLAGALIHVELGDGSALDLDLRFSGWDGPVSIVAPPADQLAPSVSPGSPSSGP